MSGRTRFEPAREVPFTPSELDYLFKLVDRDATVIRGGGNEWTAPVLALINRVKRKLSRAMGRG